MSYQVYLEDRQVACAACGREAATRTVYDWSYTSNSAQMWRAAGADLCEFAGKTAGECAAILELAIAHMIANPGMFTPMDDPDGWGTYVTLVPRLQELLEACKASPKATVLVSM